MSNESTDAMLAAVTDGIDRAGKARPAMFKDMVFVVLVFDKTTGETSWACSDDARTGLELMLQCVEVETETMIAAAELAAGASVQ